MICSARVVVVGANELNVNPSAPILKRAAHARMIAAVRNETNELIGIPQCLAVLKGVGALAAFTK